jgi:hypothetical protein
MGNYNDNLQKIVKGVVRNIVSGTIPAGNAFALDGYQIDQLKDYILNKLKNIVVKTRFRFIENNLVFNITSSDNIYITGLYVDGVTSLNVDQLNIDINQTSADSVYSVNINDLSELKDIISSGFLYVEYTIIT